MSSKVFDGVSALIVVTIEPSSIVTGSPVVDETMTNATGADTEPPITLLSYSSGSDNAHNNLIVSEYKTLALSVFSVEIARVPAPITPSARNDVSVVDAFLSVEPYPDVVFLKVKEVKAITKPRFP